MSFSFILINFIYVLSRRFPQPVISFSITLNRCLTDQIFSLIYRSCPLHTRPSPIHSSSTVSLQVQVGIPWISAIHGIPSRSETGFLLYRTEFLIIVRSDLCSFHASPFWCQICDITAHPCPKDASVFRDPSCCTSHLQRVVHSVTHCSQQICVWQDNFQ